MTGENLPLVLISDIADAAADDPHQDSSRFCISRPLQISAQPR
jgi:hypothetical protein